MKLSDKISIQQLVITAAALGLKNVIISPGSRNAPLTISFHQYQGIQCTSIRDERSAAFFALGKAMALGEPVGIVCTSGSAAPNYGPAIAEAYYLRIPLIVFTADRPAEWTGQGDGQTINQKSLYQNYIRKSYELDGDAVSEQKLWFNNRCLNEGFAIARYINPGPVHFNVPVSEPLYKTEELKLFTSRIFTPTKILARTAEADLHLLQQAFANAKKVMILVGQFFSPNGLQEALAQLSGFGNTAILCESTSNVHHPAFIENIDRCIMPMEEKELSQFMPDLLITMGGAVVSKKIKALLRNHKPAQHWNIDSFDAMTDTYQSLTHPVFQQADLFLEQFLNNFQPKVAEGYRTLWLNRAAEMKEQQQIFLQKSTYSDFFVFGKIFKSISPKTTLHLSNSTPVRYTQLFEHKVKICYSNRGVSGIDGCTSTAMGAAGADPDQPHLLITGDIAFFYDNNAFWNNQPPTNLNIILINNGGGGIFRIIPGPSDTEELEEFIETRHRQSAKKMIEFYGWNYLSAKDEPSLSDALNEFFKPGTQRTVLEIFTPSELNSQVLASYWNFLRAKT